MQECCAMCIFIAVHVQSVIKIVGFKAKQGKRNRSGYISLLDTIFIQIYMEAPKGCQGCQTNRKVTRINTLMCFCAKVCSF